MNAAFLDTAYLLALVSEDDSFHAKATEVERSFRGCLVTTEYILLELLDALTSGDQREIAVILAASVRNDPAVTVVPASTELLDAGLELFARRPDKHWGITDCISFIVMQRHGLSDAFTSDHHFMQAGFRALLREGSL